MKLCDVSVCVWGWGGGACWGLREASVVCGWLRRGALAAMRARFWAGFAGGVAVGARLGLRPVAGLAWRRGECSEASERGGEIVGPRPAGLYSQRCRAGVECEAAGDVHQPVAQALGLAAWRVRR